MTKGNNMNQQVRVLIADDQQYVRDGLKAFLAHILNVVVVGEAANRKEAVRLVEKCSPDVVLMDIKMPVMDGLAATRNIKTYWPDVRVVVLTIYSSYRAEALEAGVDDFVLKGCPAETLQNIIQLGKGSKHTKSDRLLITKKS